MEKLKDGTYKKEFYKGVTIKAIVKNGETTLITKGQRLNHSMAGIASFIAGRPTNGHYFFGVRDYTAKKPAKKSKKELASK